MKKYLYSLICFAVISSSATAQTSQSIPTGAGNADEVYFSFETGVVKTVPANDWHIAFEARTGEGFSAGIRINGAFGIELYEVPNLAIEDWANAISTDDIESWTKWHNSNKTWSLGAFNTDATVGDVNFGWGEYNTVSHNIVGTRVFVLQYSNDQQSPMYKKVLIDGLAKGVYTMKIADLDGSNEEEVKIDRDQIQGGNFAYYNVASNSIMYDREPATFTWDLHFGKYIGMISTGGQTIPYGVSGVRSNIGVKVAQLDDIDVDNVAKPADDAFSEEIDIIGYDWKTYDFPNSKYVYAENRAYFVVANDGEIYKVVFDFYGGSSTGEMRFSYSDVATSVEEDAFGRTISTAVQPNVISQGDIAYFVSDIQEPATVTVRDMRGREVASQNIQSGFYQTALPVQNIASGMYLVTLFTESGSVITHNIVVQ